MAEKIPADKVPLTVQLSPELAKRLQAAAVAHKRLAATVVIELLERHLPRPASGEQGKVKIPYS
jgi:hypothetical protein